MSSSNLRSQFNRLIFSTITSPQFYQQLNKCDQAFRQFGKKNQMFEIRQEANKTQDQQLRLCAQRYVNSFKFFRQEKQFDLIHRNLNFLTEVNGFLLNPNAFLKTIQMLGNKQQADYWRNQVLQGKSIGAYAQTQLGHGSNVQNLETEAHYQSQTKTFRLLSPKSSSSKYWPGVLGIYCTHVVLQAKTFIGKKNIGIQTFVLQIRNPKLENLNNIEVGDMGSKLGMCRVDHGFLLLNNLRVSRQAMLMKYVQIDDQGNVIGLQNKQALKYGYGSMLNLRVFLSGSFGAVIVSTTNQLVTLLRSQDSLNNEIYQRYLIESFCVGYGTIIANIELAKIFQKFNESLAKSNFEQADNYLNLCHIVSSTFKALNSWKLVNISKNHVLFNQFSTLSASLINKQFTDFIPSVTYQGDNSVLLQQTGKFILKGQSSNLKKPIQFNILSLNSILQNINYVVEKQIERVKEKLGFQVGSGKPIMQAWNEIMQRQIIQVSKIWGISILIKNYSVFLNQLTQHRAFYNKIGLIFAYSLLKDINVLSFYRIVYTQPDTWKEFSQQQRKVLFQCFEREYRDKTFKIGSQSLDQKGKMLESIIKKSYRPRL